MFAQLCINPLMGRRFKLHPFLPQEDHRKAVRRHSWSSLNVENNENDVGFLNRPPEEESFSDGDEETRSQGPDLLRPCWDVREDECRSEPGGEPLYDSIGGASSSSMGQRASSTSTLHEPLRRPPVAASAVLPPSTKLSLTWALLKKAPLVDTHTTLIKPDLSPVRVEQVAATQRPRTPHIAANRRRSSPSSKNSSSRTSASSNSASRTISSSNSRSSDSIRNFGYDIQDVDEFLSKASLQSPANIPVVLSCACVLYQPGTRRGKSGRGNWRQNELSLPLGMVVNAVFRSHGWLYVHTPHGEAGYVRYRACLPLGILPNGGGTGRWDTHVDAFPPPPLPSVSGRGRRNNKTDTEKLRDSASDSGSRPKHRHRHRPEAAVDRLFLASQRSDTESVRRRPRSSAETLLKDAQTSSRRFRSETTDTVSVKDSVSQVGVRCPKPRYPDTLDTYQKQIERNLNTLRPMHRTIALQTDFDERDSVIKDSVSEVGRVRKHSELSRSRGAMSECGLKSRNRSRAPSTLSEVQMKTETLLLIRSDYNSRGRNTLSVSRGDVVVLVSSRLKDWFWVRRTDGCEGFIPAVVAGHGFL